MGVLENPGKVLDLSIKSGNPSISVNTPTVHAKREQLLSGPGFSLQTG